MSTTQLIALATVALAVALSTMIGVVAPVAARAAPPSGGSIQPGWSRAWRAVRCWASQTPLSP
jgi:hypothetical protein